MTIDQELKQVLTSDELRGLVADARGTITFDVLERDLLRRRGEVELELSRASAHREETRARRDAAQLRFIARTTPGWHSIALRFASTALLAALGLAALIAIFQWPVGLAWLASWSSPLSDFRYAIVWVVLAVATAVLIWTAVFYFWRLPRIRQRVRIDEKLSELEDGLAKATNERAEALVRLVRDHVIEIINSASGPRWSASLRVRPDQSKSRQAVTLAVGLSEVTNDDNRITTDVQQQLLGLLDTLPGASVGISGPRGAGKSSLLASLCGANPTIGGRPAIAINTSAPVEYDGRDFLLHLFSTLCRQVLRTEGRDDLPEQIRAAALEIPPWRRMAIWATSPRVSLTIVTAGTLAVGLATMLAGLQAYVAVNTSKRDRDVVVAALKEEQTSANAAQRRDAMRLGQGTSTGGQRIGNFSNAPNPALAGLKVELARARVPDLKLELFRNLFGSPIFAFGVFLLLAGFLGPFSGGVFRRRYIEREMRRDAYRFAGRGEIAGRAADELRNIQFQRSYTTGWSGTLKLPIGLDAAMSAGLTLAERPQSLPELVERFRDFVRDVSTTYDNIVLIGIDELDKLRSAQQAEAFLNGVKSVFGIPRCFFLVSVSEHALAAFDRRGLGFRDAFDSALDDIVHVDFLTLEQSRALLNRRILRMPDPFLQLCHMLSGGLPRDLIRHARALLSLIEDTPAGTLRIRAAAMKLVERDVEARRRAVSIQMRSIKQLPETNTLLSAIAEFPTFKDLDHCEHALTSLTGKLDNMDSLKNTDEGRDLLRLVQETMTYFELMILILKVADSVSSQRGWTEASRNGLCEKIARARQALEIGVPLARLQLVAAEIAIDNVVALLPSRARISARAI